MSDAAFREWASSFGAALGAAPPGGYGIWRVIPRENRRWRGKRFQFYRRPVPVTIRIEFGD